MSLADEARELAGQVGGTCSVARLLASLPESDRDEYEEAFADRRIEAKALARALKGRGHEISEYTIRRHTRGDCKCR